jgi:hypothetical protein
VRRAPRPPISYGRAGSGSLIRLLNSRTFRRGRIALETGALVLAIVLGKLLVHELGWEFIALSSIYTSAVAGGIFVIGLIVAGTLSDYKESDRVPAELSAALENIYRDCVAIKETLPKFDLETLRERVLGIVSAFRADLSASGGRSCLAAIEALSPSFLELERLDVPANYIVRLRSEQGAIRKNVLRVYHVQRTEFLPSAYVLVTAIVALITAVALFTDLGHLDDSLPITAFLSFFFIYLVRLLKVLDTPFRVDERTMDDVSLFLLNEFAERAGADAEQPVPARAQATT